MSPDAEMSESAEETVGQQTKEADKPEVSGNYVATDNDSNSPRFSSYTYMYSYFSPNLRCKSEEVV